MELLGGNWYGLSVGSIHDIAEDMSTLASSPRLPDGVHNGIDITTIPLPHRSKPRLATKIPADNALVFRVMALARIYYL